MKNIKKCNRCGSYISAEFFELHTCVFSPKIIFTKYQYHIVNEKNESVIMACGWDGVLYRFVESKVKFKVRNYTCSSSKDLKGIAEIPIIYYLEKEPKVIVTKDWNGSLYMLSETKLFTQYPTDFDNKNNRRRLDRTLILVLSS